MKKAIIILVSLSFIFTYTTLAGSNDIESCDAISGFRPAPGEVSVGRVCIGMPLNKMLLVHKEESYCAVKFIKYWTEKDGKEKYATYEVHYQQDGTGNFANKNADFSMEKASFLPLRGILYPLIWQPGYPFIKCGNFKLNWDPWCDVCHVCFFGGPGPQGDYGIELAPTPWTDIKEVNVNDPRIKWYRYDVNRKRVNIPIDQLWENTQEKK
jgi:hypothetical protein